MQEYVLKIYKSATFADTPNTCFQMVYPAWSNWWLLEVALQTVLSCKTPNHQGYTNSIHQEPQTAHSHNGTYRNNFDAQILRWCQLLLVRTILHQNTLDCKFSQCTICKEHARIDSSSAHSLNDYRFCFHKQYISAVHFFFPYSLSLLQKWPERLACFRSSRKVLRIVKWRKGLSPGSATAEEPS